MDTSWFTPTFLFCFLNLMIITIFLANSYSKPHNPMPQLGRNNSSELARSSSVLAQVKSLNFFHSLDSQHLVHHQENEPETDSHDLGSDHQVIAPAISDSVSVATIMSKKSASEKTVAGREIEEEVLAQRPATVRERKTKKVESWDSRRAMSFKGDEEGVDAKADNFISKFRQQLKLQRLDSMKSFTEMLARGTGPTK